MEPHRRGQQRPFSFAPALALPGLITKLCCVLALSSTGPAWADASTICAQPGIWCEPAQVAYSSVLTSGSSGFATADQACAVANLGYMHSCRAGVDPAYGRGCYCKVHGGGDTEHMYQNWYGVIRPSQPCPAHAPNYTDDGWTKEVVNPVCYGRFTADTATALKVDFKNLGAPTDPNCTNPINGATGNKYQHEIDVEPATPDSPLIFERHYNAGLNRARSLGRSWQHSYDRVLLATSVEIGASAHVLRPNGRWLSFVRDADRWRPERASADRLLDVLLPDGQRQWQLLNSEDNSTELYNARGQLMAIVHANTRRVNLAYDSLDRLVSVTDTLSGRRLLFGYADASSPRIATLTTPDGQLYRYGYSDTPGRQQLLSVRYPGNSSPSLPSRQYRYNESDLTAGASLPDALTGILDERGQRIARYGYDSAGRGVLSEHAGGVNRHTLRYNADGSTTVTDALGAARTYGYSEINGLRRQTTLSQPPGSGCAAASASRRYDAWGNITHSTDFSGYVRTQRWDSARALLLETTEAAGTAQARTTRTDWHPLWRLPLRTSEPGQRTTYRYHGDAASGNASCAPASATVPAGTGTQPAPLLCEQTTEAIDERTGSPTGAVQRWRYRWSATGQLLSTDGPREDINDTTTYGYTAQGDLSSITDPLGQTIQISAHDASGRVLSLRDANGSTHSFHWSPRGALLGHNLAGLLTSYQRDASGRLTAIVRPGGQSTTFEYDPAGRLIAMSDPAGRRVRWQLDALGRILQTDWSEPGGRLSYSIISRYDALGREHSRSVRRAGREFSTRFEYDAQGRLHTASDPQGRITRYAVDPLGRTVEVRDALSGLLRLGYDGRDQLSWLQAPNQATTQLLIDGLGQLLRENSPDRGTRQMSFDAAGNPIRITDARGSVEQRSYDALNRITGVSWPASGQSLQFAWEGCSYGSGQLCAVSHPERSTRYAYDARGLLLSETRTEVGSGVGYTTSYTHNANGSLVQLRLPGGFTVVYERDIAGLVQRVTGAAAGQAPITLAESIQHDGLGRPVSLRLGNGASVTRRHHEDGLLAGQDIGGQAWPSSLGLEHDASGNVITRTRSSGNTRSTSYGYDALNRLVSEAGPAATQGFVLDANGNRLSDARGSKSYQPATNRLTTLDGQGVSLDAAGNTLQARALSFGWNAAGQLSTVSQAGRILATYAYDHRGLRVRKSTTAAAPQGEATIHYHHDNNGRLIAETTGAGQPLRSYVWLEDMPLAVIEYGQAAPRLLYLEVDQLNTPIAARDQAGRIVWRWDSDAFGSSAPHEDPDGDGQQTVINLRLPGQYYDAESQLHYNWHRYYDPKSGRYVSADPAGPSGGINSYVYAENAPLRFVDPVGLWAVSYDFFFGLGWGMTWGVDEKTCQPFLAVRAGAGTSFSAQYDGKANRSGDLTHRGLGSAFAAYAQGGFGVSVLGIGVGAEGKTSAGTDYGSRRRWTVPPWTPDVSTQLGYDAAMKTGLAAGGSLGFEGSFYGESRCGCKN